MKTSLLVMGLLLSMGSIGTTHATSTENVPWTPAASQPTLASAVVSNHIVSTLLGGLLASTTKTSEHAKTSRQGGGNAATHHAAADLGADTAIHSASRTAPHDANTQPPAIGIGSGSQADPAAPSSTDERADLGWQSLLPGSIQ